MSKFTQDLTITDLKDGKLWRLETPLVWEVDHLGSENKIEVIPGFQTDGATIPLLFRMFWSPWGKYSRSAVMHDFLCWKLDTNQPLVFCPDFQTAAHMFHQMMVAEGVGFITRSFLFGGVYIWALLREDLKIKAATPGVGYP